MGSISRKDQKILPQLVWDTIQYSLTEPEAVKYIELRIGKSITIRTLSNYKRKIRNGEYTNNFLNYFTKIGYAISHHELLDSAHQQYRDIVKTLYNEENAEPRNEFKIMKLRADLREQGYYISKLNDTTPIIAQIRVLLDRQNESKPEFTENIKREQIPSID